MIIDQLSVDFGSRSDFRHSSISQCPQSLAGNSPTVFSAPSIELPDVSPLSFGTVAVGNEQHPDDREGFGTFFASIRRSS